MLTFEPSKSKLNELDCSRLYLVSGATLNDMTDTSLTVVGDFPFGPMNTWAYNVPLLRVERGRVTLTVLSVCVCM